jgi:L-rhamnose mutarotase
MADNVMRLGKVVKVPDGMIEQYAENHRHVPEEELKLIHDHNLRNYNIFYRDGYLFCYVEYIGDDYEADMKAIDEAPVSIAWYEKNAPYQTPIKTAAKGELWSPMDPIWHFD